MASKSAPPPNSRLTKTTVSDVSHITVVLREIRSNIALLATPSVRNCAVARPTNGDYGLKADNIDGD